ncbi:hypothetical protein PR048_033374 [Dryococelus australis]|uniref:Uncharacterized protein n=1 Tax=Dryococelus australis TaxID=614101 RepID=A0ABQ9G042_9NEOP|nr:hypothetical protein PR048_033374 [Dryococelus australis]
MSLLAQGYHTTTHAGCLAAKHPTDACFVGGQYGRGERKQNTTARQKHLTTADENTSVRETRPYERGARATRVSDARLHHRGSKLDPRSDQRSTRKTVAPFEFRAIDESEIQDHEISLVQHFYIGTKIKLDPASELGSDRSISDRGRCRCNRALVMALCPTHKETANYAVTPRAVLPPHTHTHRMSRRQTSHRRLLLCLSLDDTFSDAPRGNPAPINEHLKIVYPYRMQFSQKRAWLHICAAANGEASTVEFSLAQGIFSLLAFYQREPGSIPGRLIPGFLQVGIVPDDARFSRGSPVSLALLFRRCSILASLHPRRFLVGAARPRSRSEGAIRATLTRTPNVSSLLRARRAVFPPAVIVLYVPGILVLWSDHLFPKHAKLVSIPPAASPLGEIVPDDNTGRRGFSRESSVSPDLTFLRCSVHISLPPSMLRAAQISSLAPTLHQCLRNHCQVNITTGIDRLTILKDFYGGLAVSVISAVQRHNSAKNPKWRPRTRKLAVVVSRLHERRIIRVNLSPANPSEEIWVALKGAAY